MKIVFVYFLTFLATGHALGAPDISLITKFVTDVAPLRYVLDPSKPKPSCQLYLPKDAVPLPPNSVHWDPHALVAHKRKHKPTPTNAVGQLAAYEKESITLHRSPVDATHMGFIDRVNRDVYRYDTQLKLFSVAVGHGPKKGAVKTSFERDLKDFEYLSMVNCFNDTKLSLSDLGIQKRRQEVLNKAISKGYVVDIP